MEARPQPPRPPRFWLALQPAIVRLYKVAGLIALTAILLGLVGFLIVNVFYFFDHSWVRPVIVNVTDQRVVDASTQLADARLRASQYATEKIEITEQLAEIQRTVQASEKFIADVGPAVDQPKTPEQWLLRREVDKARSERDNAVGKRAALDHRVESLKLRVAEQDKIVGRLSMSPFLRLMDQRERVVLAFVPYDNEHVKIDTTLYSCSWGLVACSSVGKVTAILDGEVINQHPNNGSAQRGVLVEIDVTADAASKNVLFAGSKPFWIF
jgi:hypothetical protein